MVVRMQDIGGEIRNIQKDKELLIKLKKEEK